MFWMTWYDCEITYVLAGMIVVMPGNQGLQLISGLSPSENTPGGLKKDSLTYAGV